MARSLAERMAALERITGKTPTGAVVGEGPPAEPTSGNDLSAIGFVREDVGFGSVWHREVRCDVLNRYGGVQFAALSDVDLAQVSRACKASAGDLAAEKLRFYDTETTGLGTAAGTFPFLHAIGQLDGDEWVVHQYFVADYEEEPSVLQTLSARYFDADSSVVSFNGRTFDWPLLLNRYVLYRLTPPSPCAHLDLLHPSRRLWKRSLGGASLGRLEEGILGAARTNDLPGKEAPARYFRYVNDAEAQPLGPVFDHNAADVSALAALTVVLAEVLSGIRPAESAGEYAALAKWYDEWQETELAERCLAQATDCPDTTWREFWFQSLYYKRQRRYEEASTVWRDMASRYPTSIPPLVELAKYAEHHLSDLAAAQRYTLTAIAYRNQVARAMRDSQPAGADRVLSQLQHRLRRVERKLLTQSE
jgi:uncharacterized protein